MAHVTAKEDPAKEAVLDACVRGFDFVQKKLEGNPKTTPIMDYMASVQKVKAAKPSKANKDVWDPEEAVRLIALHSFDIDLLPTEQLKEAAVWEVCRKSSCLDFSSFLAFSRQFQITLIVPFPGWASQAPTQSAA